MHAETRSQIYEIEGWAGGAVTLNEQPLCLEGCLGEEPLASGTTAAAAAAADGTDSASVTSFYPRFTNAVSLHAESRVSYNAFKRVDIDSPL